MRTRERALKALRRDGVTTIVLLPGGVRKDSRTALALCLLEAGATAQPVTITRAVDLLHTRNLPSDAPSRAVDQLEQLRELAGDESPHATAEEVSDRATVCEIDELVELGIEAFSGAPPLHVPRPLVQACLSLQSMLAAVPNSAAVEDLQASVQRFLRAAGSDGVSPQQSE